MVGKGAARAKKGAIKTTHIKKMIKKICSIEENKKRCSLDEAALRKNSPRGSKELSGSGGSSGFFGF